MGAADDDDRLAVGKKYQGSVITKVKETRKTLVNGLIKVRKEIHLRGGMIMIEDSYVQPEEEEGGGEAKPTKDAKSKKSSSKKSSPKKKDASGSSASASAAKPSQSRPSLKRSPDGGQTSTTSSSSRQLRSGNGHNASETPVRKSSVLTSMGTILDSKQSSSETPSQVNADTAAAPAPKSQRRKSLSNEPSATVSSSSLPSKSKTKSQSARKLVSPQSPKAKATAQSKGSRPERESNRAPLRKASSEKASFNKSTDNGETARRSSDNSGFSKVMGVWGAREAKSAPFQSPGSMSRQTSSKSSVQDSIAELPLEDNTAGDDDDRQHSKSSRRHKRLQKKRDGFSGNDSHASLSNHSSFGSLSHQSFGSLANKSNGSTMMDSSSSLTSNHAEDLQQRKAKDEASIRAEQEAAAAAARRRAEEEAAAEVAAAVAEAKRQREEEEARIAQQRLQQEAEEKIRAAERMIAEEKARREAAERRAAEEQAKREVAEQKARQEAEERKLAEDMAKKEAADRKAAEEKAKREAVEAAERDRKAAEEQARRQAAEAAERRASEEKARREAAEAAEREQKAAEERARLEAEIQRHEAEEKARQGAEAERMRKEAEEKAKQAAEAEARRLAEEKAKLEAEEKARIAAAEAKAKKKAEEKAKKEAAERRQQEEEARKALEKEEKKRKKEEKLAKKLAAAKAQAERQKQEAAAAAPPPLTPKLKKQQPKIDPVPGFSQLKGAWSEREKQQPKPSVSTNKRGHPIKLQNLCASKLDETKPFKPPIHEKSFEDKNLIRRSIEDNFMFKNLPESDFEPLVDAFEKVQYDQGETIVEQGDRGIFFYVIQDGEVSFNVNGEKVGTGKKGETFGDSALVYSMPRNASVKSERSDTVLFRVGNKNFRHLMKASTLRNEDERTKLLKSVPFFQKVDEYDLKQLSAAMTPYRFRKGENLGQTFKKTPFCLIQRGSVQAVDTGSGNKKAKIGPGGSFGADSLAKSESSMANVMALSDGEALTIDRETFEKIFGNVTRLAIKSMDKQTLSRVPAIKAEEPNDIELDTLVRQVSEVKYRKDRHLFYRDTETGPTLYMVRRGSVKITTRDGKEDIITAGGYFGDEFLLAKRKNPSDPLPQKVKAKCTAVTMEETVCGLLTLQEFRTVLSHKLSEVDEEQEDEEIKLEDLERHRILGEGLFGKVWLVTNKRAADMGPYALKIQQTSDPHRPNAVADIRSEIKMMRHLSYPFIIEVVNVYEEEKSISMLLSLAPGGELFDIIHHQDDQGNWVSGIGEKKARFYSFVVADTLAFMHRRKYVYRDLKPENILIDKDGYPVLTDFGFTKRVTDKTFTFCGTPNYLPPEIVANRGHGISADNWSLGVLIYELIEGENPFFYEGLDQMALFESICNDTYYPIETKTSKESLDLIDRLLEKDPNQRLGTFREKDILDHRWFRYCDIKKFREKKIEAPWKPGPISLHSDDAEGSDEE